MVGYIPAHVAPCGSARWDRVFRDRATFVRRGVCMCIRSMFAASRRTAATQLPIRRRIAMVVIKYIHQYTRATGGRYTVLLHKTRAGAFARSWYRIREGVVSP